MKPLRCLVGLHKGNVVPHDDGVAFHCRRCGEYIDYREVDVERWA